MTIDKCFEMPEMTIELALDRINQILKSKKLGMSEYEVALDTKALAMAINSLEAWDKLKTEIEDYMKRKWEQLSDSDKVIVTGVTTIDDWKFHMAESTLDIIDKYLQEIVESEE